MAKNREPEKPVEPDSESGEEENSSSEESDSEPELPSSSTPAAAKKLQPQSASKPQQRPSSSSLPADEESESESDSDSDGPDEKLRSIATITTKPKDDAQKSTNGARKPRSKPSAADLATPSKSTAVKRPAEAKETEGKDAKKSKKKKSSDDPKKVLFQRLWSEEDEIVILKGLMDYSIKNKTDPVADNAFYDFIKKNLHIDVSKTQVQDKIRKLKKKFENNKSREEKDGKERTFPKPHEQEAYELSKSIWGNEAVKENGVEKVVGSPKASSTALRKAAIKNASAVMKSPNVADKEEPKDAKAVDADIESVLRTKRAKVIGATVEERILMTGAELFEDGKGGERENEWNNLRMEEMEAYVRQLEVKTAQAKLVIEHLKSQGN